MRIPSLIPQIRTNVIKRHKFRFAASGALSIVGPTGATILGALGTVCTVTNTTVAQFNKSFRIRSIEAWAPGSATPATLTLIWIGLANSPNVEVSDTSITASFPAHIKTSPPPESSAWLWQVTGATQVFFITGPTGTVLDLDVDYIETDQTFAASTQAVSVGVLSQCYYLALDGPTSNLLVPVALTTTS